MSKTVKRMTVVVLVLFFGFFVGMPFLHGLFGPPRMGTGSYKHARLWRDKLAACDSPDDIRGQFNCGKFESMSGGAYRYVRDPNTYKEGQTSALLCEFPGGQWLAAAYASSHGHWGGGTVVTRDSTGCIRVFFGHVCGRPHIHGETLDDAYAQFSDPEWQEVSLEE